MIKNKQLDIKPQDVPRGAIATPHLLMIMLRALSDIPIRYQMVLTKAHRMGVIIKVSTAVATPNAAKWWIELTVVLFTTPADSPRVTSANNIIITT
jgi:hypothetical protein